MKKVFIFVVFTLFASSCSGDRLVNETFLTKNYNSETQELDLSGLNLTHIPNFGSFTGSDALSAKSLSLTGNNITLLDMSMLNSFTDLRELYINNNDIKIVRNIKTDMDILDLSENNLEILGFSSGSILKELNISSNNLMFGGDIEKLPPTITKLNLANNSLQNIDGLGELMRLKYLDLSNNSLSDGDLKELSSQKRLQYLDISGNTDMTPERIAMANRLNQKYLQKQNENSRFNKAMTESQAQ